MPEFIDIHSHVNFVAFENDRDETIRRALDANVWVVNVGTQKDTSLSAINLAEKYDKGVYAIIGLHPVHTSKSFHDIKELGEGGKEFTSRGEILDSTIYRAMASHPKVLGIGECGLDYYRAGESSDWAKEEKLQRDAFVQQIEVANSVNKPLMLHVRNGSGRSAYKDALDILKSHSKVNGNFHFFAGSQEEAKSILDQGCNLSFTGVITFARDYDEVIKIIPIDRIMTETDSPYVSPAPFRGKRNEPANVREVVKSIAKIKNLDIEIVKKAIISNASLFFNTKFS